MAIRSINADPSGQLALDANALSSLREQARTAPAEALGKAAGQFEALFLQMLLKQMRDALPQDGPLSSDATRSYTGMFDQQLAQQLSNRGLGLKKVIEQQLARYTVAAAGGADGTPPAAAPPPNRGDAVRKFAPLPMPVPSAPISSSTMPAPKAAAGVAGGITLAGGVDAFLDKLRPHAEAVGRAMGVPAHYLLAQAGLETGWGKSLPRTADAKSSHNLFGIKAGASWTGPVVEAATTENVNGRAVQSVERFRAYGSLPEAFQDFAKLLRGNARYAGAMAKAGDPQAYADGLQRAGYATDPHYGAKLARSIAFVGRKLGIVTAAPVQVAGPRADNKTTAI